MGWIGKSLVIAACLGICAASALVAVQWGGDKGDGEVAALHQVVARHLLALRTSEYADAYTQTSRTIKVRFGMDDFKGLLHHHYLPVFSANRIEFGEAVLFEGKATLRTYLIDGFDRVTPCSYHLVREHGVWRISGVTIQPTWPGDFRLGGLRV